MKKLFWSISLSVLLFSTFIPSFTYATGEVEIQAQEILSDTLIDSMNMFENSRWVTSLQQSQEAVNLFWDQEEDQINTNEEADPKIEYDNENKLITITSEKYNHSITLKDKNVWAENVWDYWDYLSFSTTICPTWFHTPSKIEWENLILLYSLIKNNESDFATDFKLPYAWAKQNWNFLGSTVSNLWYYWSSTDWTGWDYNWFYTLIKKEDWTIQTDKYFPKWMFSLTIRCFKDNNEKIKLVKFNPNWWAFSGMRENKTKIIKYTYNWDEIIPINNIQIPDRTSEDMSQQSGWMFAWWYTKDWTNNDWWEEFDISNPQTTTAYAKWLPFNDYTVNLVWTTITLMDRDLWAESNRDENYEKSEWFYYQWGNNYWFKENIIYSWTEQIEGITNSWEWNQYYSNKFIKGESNWIKNPELNTWWTEDYLALDEEKQWPCPRGYHIPNNYEFYAAADLVLRQRVISDVNYTYCWPNPDNHCITMKLNLRPRWSITNEWIYEPFTYWWFRTSTHDIINNKYYYSIWHNVTETTQANAKNIRCFKNNNTTNELKINITNDNIETKNLRWREPIGNYLKDLERIWYTLSWWFYDEKYDEEVDLNEKIHETKRIFVKWNKNPRYTFIWNWWNIDWLKEKTIKYSFKYYNWNLSSKSSYGWKKIEWAKNLKVTLKKTDDRWNYHTLYIYNYIKTSNEITNDYIMSWKVWDIVDKLIEWDTIWFIIQQSWPPINMEIDINAYLWTESDEQISNIYKVWYSFSWWYEWITGENNELIISNKEFDFDNEPVTQDRTFYAKWNPNHYTIKFDTWDIEEINAIYWEKITLPQPKKDWYIFKWWKSEDWIIYNNIIPEWTWVTTEDWVTVTLTAQWELIPAITPSAWWGQSIAPTKKGTKVTEQEHNSADNEDQKVINTQTDTPTSNTVATEEIKQQVKKVKDRSLTRWEVAIMTNILLEIYPQLVEWKQELADASNACSNYADEQNFTKDEKKAITRLCKLSIMWIHADNNKPLEEFLVNDKSTNDEFSKVINRSLSTYTEKDFSVVKDALKKLEWDEENVVFGTVYDVFMGIKNIFN